MSYFRSRCVAIFLAAASCSGVHAADKIKGGADPAIMKSGDNYYAAHTCKSSSLCISKASSLVDLAGDDAEKKEIFTDENELGDVWAPEIAIDDGKTYVYFTAGSSDDHRMYVISADDPMGDYSSEQKIKLDGDEPAIDGIMFKYEGERWFAWSGWHTDGDGMQGIYLSRMSSPTEATGPRYLISQPREPWEHVDGEVNEGPEVIVDPNGQLHIVYSTNGSWGSKYCLADLRLKEGGNPEMMWDWYKSNGCLFGSHQENMMNGWDATLVIDGPGHHTFALDDGDVEKSPGGTNRIPFVFHGVPKGTSYSWGNRNWYTGSFVWWSDVEYRRGGEQASEDTGYSFKFFE